MFKQSRYKIFHLFHKIYLRTALFSDIILNCSMYDCPFSFLYWLIDCLKKKLVGKEYNITNFRKTGHVLIYIFNFMVKWQVFLHTKWGIETVKQKVVETVNFFFSSFGSKSILFRKHFMEIFLLKIVLSIWIKFTFLNNVKV